MFHTKSQRYRGTKKSKYINLLITTRWCVKHHPTKSFLLVAKMKHRHFLPYYAIKNLCGLSEATQLILLDSAVKPRNDILSNILRRSGMFQLYQPSGAIYFWFLTINRFCFPLRTLRLCERHVFRLLFFFVLFVSFVVNNSISCHLTTFHFKMRLNLTLNYKLS